MQYMRDHTHFARNRISKLGWQGSDKTKTMWKNLRKIVNSRPGPKFSTRELPKVIEKFCPILWPFEFLLFLIFKLIIGFCQYLI